jgi:hypothetical protein
VFGTDIDLSSYISKNKQIIADFMNGDMTQFSAIQKGIAEEVAAGYAD